MNPFQPLNLPVAQLRIEPDVKTGKPNVFDALRRKFVALTPEEWVRQHFVSYMISGLGYPVGLTANEMSITLNSTSRRCDTVVFDASGKPLVIVEYKAPSVAISQKTFDQIVRYNMVLRARYLVVSNGINHYCCRIDYEKDTYAFIPALPRYDEIK